MKKILIFGLLLGMFACSNSDKAVPDAADAVIEAQDVAVAGEGGEATVGYTVRNPISGEGLSAATDADWISAITVEESVIRFTVAANTSTESRSAGMTLKYKSAADVTITVTQSVADTDFLISVDAVGTYGATITYTPLRYTGDYLFLVVEKSALDPYLVSADALETWYAADLKWLQTQASNNGMTLAALIESASQIFGHDGEAVTISYSSLAVNTEYYAYCYGLDGEGNRLTDMCYTEFKTSVAATADLSFEAAASDITTNGARITVTPSSDEETYYWTYISEFDFANKAGSDVNQVMSLMIETLLWYQESYGNPLSDYLCRGVSTQQASDLWSGTLYRIVAWGMDDKGTPTTEPVEVTTFTTLSDSGRDDCTFDISVPEVKDMDMLIKVVPSNPATRYYIAPVEESVCSGYNDEQMAQRIINMETARFEQGFYGAGVDWSNFESVYTGEQELWGRADLYWTFLPDHNYRIFVFGVDEHGVRTTDVARFDQRTASVAQSSLTVGIELVEAHWDYAVFRFTPSNDEEYYLPYLAYTDDVDLYRNADGSLDGAGLMEEINYIYDGETNYYVRQGVKEVRFAWSAGVDYTMLVCGYAGSNTTDFFEYRCTAPEIPFGESDADVSATYEFFDGDELAARYPAKWRGYEDNCIVYIRYTPNEKAVHWYGGVWMPVEIYEHDGGIAYLLMLIQNQYASHVDRYSGQYSGLGFGTTYSLSYCAEGEDGTFGPWHYEEITPVRGENGNMTEPYDFWSQPSANGRVLCLPKSAAADRTPTAMHLTGERKTNYRILTR